MKLIREEFLETRTIIEEEKGQKFLCIEGPMLEAEVKNRNGRWYPASIMEREVARYTQEKIARGTSWGELGHPNGPGINLDRISHLTTSLVREGNSWIGRARLADTAPGNTARKLMETGGTLGVSSRGLGSLKMDQARGYQLVQDDFHLAVASDIVADPSAPNAFVKGIMEGVEFFYDTTHGTWAQKMLEPVREQLVKATIEQIEESKTALFETFLKRLGEPVNEQSSLHGTFKSNGYRHVDSRDVDGGTLHTYAGARGETRINGLHRDLKRHAGYHWKAGHTTKDILKSNRMGHSAGAGVSLNDSTQKWSHHSGSYITHHTEGDHHVIHHHVKGVNEQVIFETELAQINLALRAGVRTDTVTRAWNQAKVVNESMGRDPDDYDNISRIAFRMLGLH